MALISAIGMSIFLQNWVALGQGARDMAVPSLLPGAFNFHMGDFEVFVPYTRILIIVVAVVLMAALTFYIRHSRMGRASRACSQDMQMANLLGIDTNKVVSFTFILGAVLAAALLAGRWGLWIAPGPAVLAIIAAYPLWGWRRLAAVSDFLASEAAGLAPAGLPAGPTLGGFDNVAKQVSLLRHLVGEVAERRAFLARVIDTAPDAICVFGADGRLVLMNPRARALFGEEPSGLTLNDLVLSVRGHLVDEGRELVLPDGGAYAVARSRATGAAAPGTEGEWAGIAVIAFIDITDIRRAEEERRHLLEFLSHDMRSPQVAILGLSDPREGHGTAEDRFARIARHARRTLKLADDFVHLSRIAEAPLAREEVDLAMLVDEALDRAWFAAREKAIRLEAVLPGDPVYVEADGDVLSRAVDNLVGNAIKYGPTGSRVTVTVLAGDAGISLAIADEGPGLPEGRREEPFRRFGPRDKAAGTGAGLGLAFVETAVLRHGATIACRSTPGAGTTFVITFPAG